MQLTAEQEEIEQNNGALLASIGNVDVQVARRVLRKHKGDMEKAADAILAGDLGHENAVTTWESQRRNTPEPTFTSAENLAALPNNPLPSASVIDLTADDEDMTRAIEMSMQESSQNVPQFGPSERAPHPEWQVVRADAPVGVSATHEDHTLNEAIQASLQDFKEDVDLSPFMESVREGGRPIALRPEIPSLAYAALVLQALYYIPQVRLTISNLRLPLVQDNTPLDDPARAMWNLIELFTNMDLAQLAAIVDTAVLPSLDIPPLQVHRSLAEASSDVVKNIASLIEQHLQAEAGNEEPEHLFSFTHGQVKNRTGSQLSMNKHAETGSVVSVEFGGGQPHNDLISCISDNLNKVVSATSSLHDVIIRPSEVVGFHLRRSPNPPSASGAKVSPDPFVYPKTLFMDRFLLDNFTLVNEKRRIERELLDDIEELRAYKEKLTHSGNKDSLQSLRSTIYYYEHVADAGDDPARKRMLGHVADHLNDIMTMITGKIEDIDHQIETRQKEAAAVFDCPELQMFQYDLRAVLLHTGLPGRKQIYSYVQDTEGAWWKTLDHEVTEVPEETVLTDPTGIHLGAGPYLLLYSRHMSHEQLHEELVWPHIFSAAVEENNRKFLAMMHPGLDIFSASARELEEAPRSPERVHDMMHSSPVTRELPSVGSTSARELPVPKENLRRATHHREGSRGMSVAPEEMLH